MSFGGENRSRFIRSLEERNAPAEVINEFKTGANSSTFENKSYLTGLGDARKQVAHAKQLGFSDRQIAAALRTRRGACSPLPSGGEYQSLPPPTAWSTTCGGRVRGLHALLLLHLRQLGRRGARFGQEEDHDPRGGPNRIGAGHRVRLLLRPRRVCPEGNRVRDHHGQLEPGDGLDRLRHVGTNFSSSRSRWRTCSTSAIACSRTASSSSSAGSRRRSISPPGWRRRSRARRRRSSAHVGRVDRAARRDRKLFQQMLNKLGLNQPPNGTATNEDEAVAAAAHVGYPVLVRPSFVLGGRAMQIVYSDDELRYYMRNAVAASPERPVLVDRFLDDDNRGGRRLHRRRRDRGDRRDHGAHRAGGRPFRRLGLRHSRAHAFGKSEDGDSRGDGEDGQGARLCAG